MVLWNGGLWSAGNGLTSGAVIYYLAFEMGASGSDIGWIMAAPALAGLLRMFSPQVICFFGSARRACLLAWFFSYLVALGIPLLALPTSAPLHSTSGVGLFVVVLAAHQLLEYVGVVGFWAWMADLVPQRIRGRYFARRNRWQLAALIPTLLFSGWLIDVCKDNNDAWGGTALAWGYVTATSLGAVLLLASLVPLMRIRKNVRRAQPASAKATATAPCQQALPSQQVRSSNWLAPFQDSRFLRLLVFGCFVAMANGITQSAQSFANKSYGVALAMLAAMRISMLMGQFTASGVIGRFSDRYGNRPVLILAQAIVALGPMFYLLASPAQPWWIWGAWIAWSAFAAHNICLPNLMLKLAPAESKAAYIATYFAISGVIYALSTIAGGYLLDALRALASANSAGSTIPAERILFLIGWMLRTLSVLLLIWLIEPGAIRWSTCWTTWLRRRSSKSNLR